MEELKLGQHLQELHATDERSRLLRAQQEQAEGDVFSRRTVAAEELAMLDSFRRYAQAQHRMLGELRHQQQQNVDAQRERVLEARRQFELLDRLCVKALLEWQAAFNKEQDNLASELFLAGVSRRS